MVFKRRKAAPTYFLFTQVFLALALAASSCQMKSKRQSSTKAGKGEATAQNSSNSGSPSGTAAPGAGPYSDTDPEILETQDSNQMATSDDREQTPEGTDDEVRTTSPLKIALILGPGGLRSFAHAGVVQELIRAKIPIGAMAGIEWGSLTAALGARKGQPFEPEWQMMKIKEEDLFERSLLGERKLKSNPNIESLLNRLFADEKTDSATLPFACPSFHLEKRSAFVLERGLFKHLLPMCLAFPPTLPPQRGSIADARQLSGLVDFLKTKGFNFFIYVNLIKDLEGLIPSSSTSDSIPWAMIHQALETQLPAVQFVFDVPLRTSAIEFDQRKQVLELGKNTAKKALPALLKSISDFEKSRVPASRRK